jgi:two-component sensor histidine kinase
MYQSSDLHELCFSEHLRALTLEVRATGAPPPGVELVLDIDDGVMLRVDQAIPCAMIVHELLVNAFKHAFPGGRHGTVRVSCHEQGAGSVAVSVEDDGVGMTSLTGAHGAGLGWTLVDAFVRQLGATLESDISQGTLVRLRFEGARAPRPAASERARPAWPAAAARGGAAAARVAEAEAEAEV